MFKGLLFDLFGTVVSPFSRSRHSCELAAAAQHLGLDAVACEAAWRADYENRVLGKSGDFIEQLTRVAAVAGVEVSRDSLDPIAVSYVGFCNEAVRPVPTAMDTLRGLADRSVPVGLVSNTAPDLAAAFDRSPLRSFFATCTYSFEVGVAKPDPAIYVMAADGLGLGTHEILYVGDGSDNELVGAALAGCTPALVEIDTSDTYDPVRAHWSGIRLDCLADVLGLLGQHTTEVGVDNDEMTTSKKKELRIHG